MYAAGKKDKRGSYIPGSTPSSSNRDGGEEEGQEEPIRQRCRRGRQNSSLCMHACMYVWVTFHFNGRARGPTRPDLQQGQGQQGGGGPRAFPPGLLMHRDGCMTWMDVGQTKHWLDPLSCRTYLPTQRVDGPVKGALLVVPQLLLVFLLSRQCMSAAEACETHFKNMSSNLRPNLPSM